MCFIGKKLEFVNPFPNKPWFSCVCSISLLKTLGKGEIAHNNRLENHLPFSYNSKLSSAKSFNLEESKICRLEKA